MKRELGDLMFLVCVSTSMTVMMEPSAGTTQSNPNIIDNDESAQTFSEALAECIAKKIHGTFQCINEGSLTVLRSLNDEDKLDFGQIKLERSDHSETRDLLELDYDPNDFGNVVKAAARLMERRNLKWDFDNIYPGLQMRVGPMLNGNGVLEFIVDERTAQANRQLGTGRMLMRSLVLPFLLGFKFSLASLIPLIFGVLLVITKKALFLTKIALMLSGLLGWNAFATSNNYAGIPQTIGSSFASGFNDYNHHQPTYHDHNTIHEPLHYPYRPYRHNGFGYNQHVIREVVDVYDTDGDSQDNTPRAGKNFIWTTKN